MSPASTNMTVSANSWASAQQHGAEQWRRDLPSVLLLRPPFTGISDALAGRFNFLKLYESPLPRDEFLAAQGAGLQALVTTQLAPVDLLDRLPRLKLVAADSTGVNHIDLGECRRRGIAVTNAGTVFSDDVADYAVGLVINVVRRISAHDRYVRQGLWPTKCDRPRGSKMSKKRVGIVGLGSIGSRIAKRLEAFGCPIMYTSRTRKAAVPYKFFPGVVELAAESDVLVVSCALTKDSHHLIDQEVLLSLGSRGVLINVGRGPLVDEGALVQCLMRGEIAGAGLDVFENEPEVPPELLYLDNVVLSPHEAAFTPESFQAQVDVIVSNLEAFFSDEPLMSPVF